MFERVSGGSTVKVDLLQAVECVRTAPIALSITLPPPTQHHEIEGGSKQQAGVSMGGGFGVELSAMQTCVLMVGMAVCVCQRGRSFLCVSVLWGRGC